MRVSTMMANSKQEISEDDLQMMVALRRLRTYFLNGQFRAALNMLTEGLMREPKNPDQL